MPIAVRTWAELGNPTNRAGLSDALQLAIKRIQERGLRYPPILLRRKRALDRGDWAPKASSIAAIATARGACPDCGGSGYKVNGASADLCPCGAWDKRQSR